MPSTLSVLAKVERLRRLRVPAVRPPAPTSTDEGVLDFVQRVNPRYMAPRHLGPLVELLERSWTQPVEATAHAPPRHAKTETVLAWLALTLKKYPHKTVGYCTYSADLARSKSRKARSIARACGVPLDGDANALGQWLTKEGGGFLALGITEGFTGRGVDILVVDDPYKSRIQAESAAYRAMVLDWWSDVAETRVEPGGSKFVFHTRWTNDDLIAAIHDGEDGEAWTHVHMPAVSDAGEALWPERWPLPLLQKKERAVGPYTWASLYQGRPRPRGEGVFSGPVHFYDELPTSGYAVGGGADLAYTAKSYADYSVLVVLYRKGDLYYVADVLRLQVKAPAFSGRARAVMQRYPGASTAAYLAGPERGSADLMSDTGGLDLDVLTAGADKFLRAQPVAAAWNDGKILVPREAPWLDAFLAELRGFTGVKDVHDDQVDALAAAFDSLAGDNFGGEILRPRKSRW